MHAGWVPCEPQQDHDRPARLGDRHRRRDAHLVGRARACRRHQRDPARAARTRLLGAAGPSGPGSRNRRTAAGGRRRGGHRAGLVSGLAGTGRRGACRCRRPGRPRPRAPACAGTSRRAAGRPSRPARRLAAMSWAATVVSGNETRARSGCHALREASFLGTSGPPVRSSRDERRRRRPARSRCSAWYAEHARDLPWRGAGATPWRVMVSEFMLQQTPVARVLPVFEAWLETWPTPAALAAAPERRGRARVGAARLPATSAAPARRATTAIVGAARRRGPGVLRRRCSRCPASATTPRARSRRSRSAAGTRCSTPTCGGCSRVRSAAWSSRRPSVTSAERTRAESMLPDDDLRAGPGPSAVMELGALVCTAEQTRAATPARSGDQCAWWAAGRPAYDGPPRRGAGLGRHRPAWSGAG